MGNNETGKVEFIDSTPDGRLYYQQPGTPMLTKIRHRLIRWVVGDLPVFMNMAVQPHSQDECGKAMRVVGVHSGLFYKCTVGVKADIGITFRGDGQTERDTRVEADELRSWISELEADINIRERIGIIPTSYRIEEHANRVSRLAKLKHSLKKLELASTTTLIPREKN